MYGCIETNGVRRTSLGLSWLRSNRSETLGILRPLTTLRRSNEMDSPFLAT